MLVLSSLLTVVIFNIAEQPYNTSAVYAQKTQELAQDNTSAEQPLVVIAYLTVKPEHRQTFLDLARDVVETTNETEEGATSYLFYESQDTPNSFFFFEDWQSRTAFEEHLQKDHTRSLTDKYPEILAEPADVIIYDVESIEQLQIP